MGQCERGRVASPGGKQGAHTLWAPVLPTQCLSRVLLGKPLHHGTEWVPSCSTGWQCLKGAPRASLGGPLCLTLDEKGCKSGARRSSQALSRPPCWKASEEGDMAGGLFWVLAA